MQAAEIIDGGLCYHRISWASLNGYSGLSAVPRTEKSVETWVEAQAIQTKRAAFKESKFHPKSPMQSYSEEGEASANGEGIRAAIDHASLNDFRDANCVMAKDFIAFGGGVQVH
jgi:hypothetical protein